jgi:hypothetical protein
MEKLQSKPFELQGSTDKRLIVSLGGRYDFNGSGLQKTEDMPDFLLAIRKGAAQTPRWTHCVSSRCCQYPPGAAISWHKDRFTASNVDAGAKRKKPDSRKKYTRKALGGLGDHDMEQWFVDPRIPETQQLPDRFFTKDKGAFNKGHLVRREDVAWGDSYEEIRFANGDTFHTTNCSPQVAGFNRPAVPTIAAILRKSSMRRPTPSVFAYLRALCSTMRTAPSSASTTPGASAGRQSDGTSRRSGDTASRAIQRADHVSVRLCCTGPMTAARFDETSSI